MTGFAVPRLLRKPALAVLAMAGLVAWGDAAPADAARTGPSRDGISGVEQLRSAALVSGAAQVGAMAESRDRPTPRTDGGASRAAKSRSEGPRLAVPVVSRADDASLTAFLARTRAGRDTAPSRGPPSLPF